MKQAVIYARVSTDKQAKNDNIESQIQRCTEYCIKNGYKLLKTFKDDGISGKLENRPAIRELLSFLSSNKQTIVIIDDIKRLARDTSVYLTLKAGIEKLDCSIHYLNHSLENTPESNFIEILLSATAQLEREQGARQVKQKMEARLKLGYWQFHAPFGYKQTRDKNRLLELDEVKSEFLKEMFQKFINDELKNIADCQRFLRLNGYKATCSNIKKMLLNPLYAGYYEYKKWDIPFMKALHPAIISLEDYNKIQIKLNKRIKTVYTTDNINIFFHKEFLFCDCCFKRLYSGFSRGKRGIRYPFYFCRTKNCKLKEKTYNLYSIDSIIKDKLKKINIDDDFIDFLKCEIEYYLLDNQDNQEKEKEKIKNEIEKLELSIKNGINKLINSNDNLLNELLEKSLNEMNQQKLILENQLLNDDKNIEQLLIKVEKVLNLFKKVDEYYEKSDNEEKKIIIKLFFDDKIHCIKNVDKSINLNTEFSSLVSTLLEAKNIKISNGGVKSNKLEHIINIIFDLDFVK